MAKNQLTNPFIGLEIPSVPKQEIDTLTPEEVGKILESINPNTATGARNYAMVLLLLMAWRNAPGFVASGLCCSMSVRRMAVTSAARAPCPMTSQRITPACVSERAKVSKKSPPTTVAGR